MAEGKECIGEFADLLPRQIVEELDRYIIGQQEAKRAVAIALRNRFRREQLPEDMRDEIMPKNILMIGPTGVGKTEIARRLAKMANAPFIKVEATKYTEVGYVGRDVESMIRDLADVAVHMVSSEFREKVRSRAHEMALERVLEILKPTAPRRARKLMGGGPVRKLLQSVKASESVAEKAEENAEEAKAAELAERERLRKQLWAGELSSQHLDIEVDDSSSQDVQLFTNSGIEEMGVNFTELLGGLVPKRKKTCRVTVAEALEVFQNEEEGKLVDFEAVKREAVHRVESRGIVFLDELDKIAGKSKGSGPDVSREGVQRDILPIVEGSTVTTKYGPVHTDHILFIAAGAFHVAKPSELIPELQGRFPIRVNLSSLSEEDLQRILVEPKNALTRQYRALLSTEGVELEFTDDGIAEMARMATEINSETENIGARRLHTIVERALEKVSFDAAELEDKKVIVDREFVQRELHDVVESRDLSRFIL